MTEAWLDEPLISVVTLGHNQAAEMERTARSLIAQGWREFEWIVVDGASVDDTLTRLEPFRTRITALICEPNAGVHDAMNRGLARCSGRYVLFLRAGDWFASSEALAHVVRRLHLGNAPALLYGRLQLVDPEDGYRYPRGAPFQWRHVAFGKLPPWPACFARRLTLEALGGFSAKFGHATEAAASLALVATGGGVDFLPMYISVVPFRRDDPRLDGGAAVARARSVAIRALAPRWVGRLHRLLLPAWIGGAVLRDVLEALGLLSACRKVRRTFAV